MLTDGTRESSFLMSEKFGINRAFRNGTTVDGKVLLVLSRRVVVNNARDSFLTHTVLTLNEDG